MSIVIKDFIEKLTLEKKEDRLEFNKITDDEFNDFKVGFLKEEETNKLDFLIKIIEETDETELLEGKFKSFFDDDMVKDLLKKCL